MTPHHGSRLVAREESAKPPGAPRPRCSGTIVLVLSGPIGPADVMALGERARVLLGGIDADLVVCDVGALDDPDAAAVDALAHLQVTARRMGRRIHLRRACGELRELLILMGLDAILPPDAASGLESLGQTEEREQALRVEKE